MSDPVRADVLAAVALNGRCYPHEARAMAAELIGARFGVSPDALRWHWFRGHAHALEMRLTLHGEVVTLDYVKPTEGRTTPYDLASFDAAFDVAMREYP